MGVQIYVLDRRLVTLLIGGTPYQIGSLRRFWKVTEIDDARTPEVEAAKLRVADESAPAAVMVNDVTDAALVENPDQVVPAHLVLGWDADRAAVTDMNWEYLPVLGYAIRRTGAESYVLHEAGEGEGGLLRPVTRDRALDRGLLTVDGQLARHGQPRITVCRGVTPFIETYAEADCLLADGTSARILTSVTPGHLPDPAWYAGKRPADVATYPADRAA